MRKWAFKIPSRERVDLYLIGVISLKRKCERVKHGLARAKALGMYRINLLQVSIHESKRYIRRPGDTRQTCETFVATS